MAGQASGYPETNCGLADLLASSQQGCLGPLVGSQQTPSSSCHGAPGQAGVPSRAPGPLTTPLTGLPPPPGVSAPASPPPCPRHAPPCLCSAALRCHPAFPTQGKRHFLWESFAQARQRPHLPMESCSRSLRTPCPCLTSLEFSGPLSRRRTRPCPPVCVPRPLCLAPVPIPQKVQGPPTQIAGSSIPTARRGATVKAAVPGGTGRSTMLPGSGVNQRRRQLPQPLPPARAHGTSPGSPSEPLRRMRASEDR